LHIFSLSLHDALPIFRAGFDFVFEAANLLIKVGYAGIGADGDDESGPILATDHVAADVQPAIEVVHNVDQADGVHVENSGGVGIDRKSTRLNSSHRTI